MHSFAVFPLFLKYLMNAEYMINSWAITLKSILIHNNSSAYGNNFESRMLGKILYVVGKSDMPL